jgi:alkanesulfonate monooxygenase SsuD/methylene tetrahydromethanopterin reductase-like flavin-dependent oxidoreductase (luciferase family)
METQAPAISFLGDVGVSPRDLVALAQRAEADGLSGAWMIEYEYDSVALDQAIAMNTRTIMTGSCITRTMARHPLLQAQSAIVIDHFAPGRYIVGLGPGPQRQSHDAKPLERWGMSAARGVARMSEYIDLVRLALSGEVIEHHGEFYPVSGLEFGLKSVSPYIPIYLAAAGPQMLRLAGRKADGFFTFLVNEAATRSRIEQVRASAAEAGRDPDSLVTSLLIMSCVSNDRESARSAMRRYMVQFYLRLPFYQADMRQQGYEDEAREVRAAWDDGDKEGAAAAVSDQLLDAWAISGTPDECQARLADFVARGIDLPILYPFPADDNWLGAYHATVECFGQKK